MRSDDHDPNSKDFHDRLGKKNEESSSGNGGRA